MPTTQPVGAQHAAPVPTHQPHEVGQDPTAARLARLRARINPASLGPPQPDPNAPWLIPGLLRAGNLHLLVGHSGVKKTYLMLHLALHVALGRPWLGRPLRQAPVLYLDEDMGPAHIARRIALLARGLRLKDITGLYTASFNHWRFPAQSDRDILLHTILERRAGLVIIDTFNGLAPFGLDHDLRRILQTFDALCYIAYETGVAFILIHHLNKHGAFLGVSHLKTLADSLIHIHSAPMSPLVHLETSAMRGQPRLQLAAQLIAQPPGAYAETIEFLPVSPTDGEFPAGKLQEVERSSTDFVLAHLALHGPADRPTLHAAARRHTPAALDKALFRLRRRGLIQRIGRNPTFYRLAHG